MKQRLARLPVVGTVLRVLERYRLDAAEQFAGSIALFVFLALVPVALLGVAVLGYVLRDPETQLRVVESLAESVPGLGATLGDGDGVEGFVRGVVDARGALTAVGLVGIALTALRPVNAAMTATVTVFRGALPLGMKARLRQVGALLALGAVAMGAVVTSSMVGFVSLPGPVRWLVSVGATYALDVLLFWTAYTILSPGARMRGWSLLPGALLAGAGWTALKVLGSAYVSAQIESANALYGALGGVVALLLLLYLGARMYLYGAELAAVRHERRHGPLPVPVGATALARIDELLPDGSHVTPAATEPVPSGVPAGSPTRTPASATFTGSGGAGGAGKVDPRRVAVFALGTVAVAAAYRLLRDD